MADPPAAAVPQPCCVCAAPGGTHCAKCKSKHYCGKVCLLADWYERGHKAACTQLAAVYQKRSFPEELSLKSEEVPAAGPEAAPPTAADDAAAVGVPAPDWRGTCAICLDLLPFATRSTFYECCCNMICTACAQKCLEYDARCPLCRAPASKSDAEWVQRVEVHAAKGQAEALMELGDAYIDDKCLAKDARRAVRLYERAATTGHARAQNALGCAYGLGSGVNIDYQVAAHWYRRAAEQGYPAAQRNLGIAFYEGKGVAQSYGEAVKWLRLAAAQGDEDAQNNLAVCYANGCGVAQDVGEALRLFKLVGAWAAVDKLGARLAASGRPTPSAVTST